MAALTLVVYTWLVYPILLAGFRAMRHPGAPLPHRPKTPFVSIIVPVHNEQAAIAAKLENCLTLDYPIDRMEIIVSSDDSTDGTEQIVRSFLDRDRRIRWIKSERREGKSGVQNLAAAAGQGDILFFTDANTRMGPSILSTVIDRLADDGVGLVTGTVHLGDPEGAVAKSQGFYWRYELFLRLAESDLGILATASGQAMAVRKEFYRQLPTCYGDDCILPLDVRLQATEDSGAIRDCV